MTRIISRTALILLVAAAVGCDDDQVATTTPGIDVTSSGDVSQGDDAGPGEDTGLGGDVTSPDDFTELSLAVCDPDAGGFTTVIDNPYLPLAVGSSWVLEGTDDEGATIRVEVEVLDQTENVAGVTTRVVQVAEYEDEALFEISRDYYVQAADGTVCYYGEDVDIYENGVVVDDTGSWRAVAGSGGAHPGILMPGDPQPGTRFDQEQAPGVAEDVSAIIALGQEATVPAGTFGDVIQVLDWNPLEGETSADGEIKLYARGIGLVLDDAVELISYQIPGGGGVVQ